MKNIAHSITCIVAATDFSANGDLAVLRAAHIAQQNNKELHLVHVVSPLEIYPELMLTFDSHLKDYERLKNASGLEKLDQLAVKIRQEFGIKVVTKVSIGRAHAEVSKFAKEKSADLVVVGFHGETNLMGAMMGSTASKLVLKTPCAVLVVKNSEVVPYKQAVAAVDLTEKSTDICLAACAVASSAQVEALHVFDAHQKVFSEHTGMHEDDVKKYYDEATKHIAAELDGLIGSLDNKQLSSIAIEGYEPQVICARATEINADLVVLGKKGKSVMQEFLLGSVSKAVVDMSDCDVLLA